MSIYSKEDRATILPSNEKQFRTYQEVQEPRP